MNSKQNIAVIGAGNLGKFHLFSLLSANDNFNFYIVDISENQLEKCKTGLQQLGVKESTLDQVKFYQNIEDLPFELFFVVIATTSLHRLEIIKKLHQEKRVLNLLAEKFLFPKVSDYEVINQNTNLSKKSWVNCPRRMYEGYKFLKENHGHQITKLEISGNNWGLLCNSIHFIDLANFLIEFDPKEFQFFLDKEIVESKRDGYQEMYGEILIRNQDKEVVLFCEKDMEKPISLKIKLYGQNGFEIAVDESKKEAFISRNGEIERIEFGTKYQSQLTSMALDQISKSGVCDLPTLEVSAKLHETFLKELISYLKNKGIHEDIVIT